MNWSMIMDLPLSGREPCLDGRSRPNGLTVVEKANSEAERRCSAADSACALAIGTDGRRHRGCRRWWFMGGRRIELRSHRRVPCPDLAVAAQAAGNVP